MKVILAIMFILASVHAIADDSSVELGDTVEKLIKKMGSPSKIVEVSNHNGVFQNYIYKSGNILFIVDKRKGIVCEIGGSEPDVCYPCSGEGGVDLCL